MAREVRFILICTNMPGVEFGDCRALRLGIQEGKEVVADVPADTPEPTFDFALRVEENAQTGQPNFLGKFAQGTPRDRFVYLCWGERNGDVWEGIRRAKIPLTGISWQQIETAAQSQRPIRAIIKMSDKGGPIAATVKANKIRWEA